MECIVRGCIFSYGRPCNINNNVVMYEFPRELNLRKLWLKALNINEYELKNHWYVCEHHFSIYDYNTDGTLKYGAIPWLDIHNYSGDPMDVEELEKGLEKDDEMPTRKKYLREVNITKSETDFTKDIKFEDATIMQKEIEVVVTVDTEKTSTRTVKKNSCKKDTTPPVKQILKALPDTGKNEETKPSTSTAHSAEPSKKSSKLTKEPANLRNNTVQQSKRIKKETDHSVISSFGRFVSSRLRTFKNEDIRQKVQHKIMEVIIRYEEKDIADST